jgi:hypothetical protein
MESYYQQHPKIIQTAGGNVCTIDQGTACYSTILNADHTHFLMVDNGLYGKSSLSGAARLRATLEKHINEACKSI